VCNCREEATHKVNVSTATRVLTICWLGLVKGRGFSSTWAKAQLLSHQCQFLIQKIVSCVKNESRIYFLVRILTERLCSHLARPSALWERAIAGGRWAGSARAGATTWLAGSSRGRSFYSSGRPAERTSTPAGRASDRVSESEGEPSSGTGSPAWGSATEEQKKKNPPQRLFRWNNFPLFDVTIIPVTDCEGGSAPQSKRTARARRPSIAGLRSVILKEKRRVRFSGREEAYATARIRYYSRRLFKALAESGKWPCPVGGEEEKKKQMRASPA